MTHVGNFVVGTRVIGSVHTPNPRYRGHRGVVIHVLEDMLTHEHYVHVRWDRGDEPIGDQLQLMSAHHMDVDRDWVPENEKPHIIQEEPV